MASLKINSEILTNFIVPIYENFLRETDDIQESKKDTVGILVDSLKKFTITDDEFDPYTILPIIDLFETTLANRIKELSSNRVTNKGAIEFYKGLLLNIHQYHDICLKMKK